MPIAFALAGCARVSAYKARVTAMPVYSAEDPEQPLRPSDYSGLIVSATQERISIQLGARPDGESVAIATVSSAAAGSLDVPLAKGVLIRQSRDANTDFLNLTPYEIVPGLHAEVWLDEDGNAAYIRVSVRVHLEALA